MLCKSLQTSLLKQLCCILLITIQLTLGLEMQIQDLGNNSKNFEDCEVVLTETLLYIRCNTKGYQLYLVDDIV